MNDNKECPQTKHEPVSYPDPLTETVIKFHYIFLGTFLYVIIYIYAFILDIPRKTICKRS